MEISDEQWKRSINIMAGLTADGLTLLEEAIQGADTDEKKAAIAEVKKRLDEEISIDVGHKDYDCTGWDGESRRCDCGRRMYWHWDERGKYYHPESY